MRQYRFTTVAPYAGQPSRLFSGVRLPDYKSGVQHITASAMERADSRVVARNGRLLIFSCTLHKLAANGFIYNVDSSYYDGHQSTTHLGNRRGGMTDQSLVPVGS